MPSRLDPRGDRVTDDKPEIRVDEESTSAPGEESGGPSRSPDPAPESVENRSAGARPPWGRLALATAGLIASLALLAIVVARGNAPAGDAPGPGGLGAVVEAPTLDSRYKGFAMVPERPAPDFSLTAQTGEPFQLSDARGKAALVFFGFTYCPDICPMTLQQLSQALALLEPELAERVQVVLISVDPERDTPEVMARYLQAYDPRIVGVTGELPAIEAVAQGYGVRFFKESPTGGTVEPGAEDYTMAHSSTVFLVDPFGQLRVSYLGAYTPQDLADDLRLILEEAEG